jgi:hypothetical protein
MPCTPINVKRCASFAHRPAGFIAASLTTMLDLAEQAHDRRHSGAH